ncbi:MAG: YhgE/Pip domain-containing protein [Eubacterium sp.]|nr:YhgE/Pip domain-containing protein [Eubacterium sp.]
MTNIIKIMLRDLRSVRTNVVAMVILMGLCVIPSLYAWFNIHSNWDPYSEGATSNLKIAVCSKDEGVQVKNLSLAVGESVVSALHDNHTIGWVFPQEERTAINGVYSGEYYAALIIPEDFTKSIAGIAEGNLDGGKILYYENDKKNAIATKITGKAKTAVETQVNTTVFATITELAARLGSVLENTDDHALIRQTAARMETLKADIKSLQHMLGSAGSMTDAALETMKGLVELNDKIILDLRSGIGMLATASAASTSGIETANVRLQDYLILMEDGKSGINRIRRLLKQMYTQVDALETELLGIKDSELLQQLVQVLENEPEKIAAFFSSPVDLQKERVYPIKNYGSQMAPFYTVLAIWVGALIQAAIIHTKVHPAEGIDNVKHYQEYFGRYAVFFLVGQIQTLICVLGDVFFLDIQCVHLFLFWCAAALASFVFTLLIYSLTYAFGNVGEALAVVIMVIQVAGAGGTFPKEVLPDIYQQIYTYLPFPYAMDALKEAVGGIYENAHLESLGWLAAFLPVSLLIGLVLSIPFRRLNAVIEESKERSKLMI